VNDVEKKDIDKIFADGTLIDQALKRAARTALRQHKRDGRPVAEWRDGRVVWIQPEDIRLDDEADEPNIASGTE
jgi:hypothetical protein